jgi:hypothetical protein
MINEKHFVDSNPNYFKEKRERELAEKLSKKSLGNKSEEEYKEELEKTDKIRMIPQEELKKSEEEYRRLRMNMIKQADESVLKIAVMRCLKSLKKLLMEK